MDRRLAIALSGALSLLLLLALALAGPVLAKEGMQARLDAPIPADTPPGTTIEVGWTTFQTDGQGGRIIAFSGAPVYIALTAPGASKPASRVFGDEYPSGSGHFTASIRVPDGGIAPDGVTIGLPGESCQDGVCTRNDIVFELAGEVLASAPVVAPASPAAAPASAAPDPAASQVPEPAGDSTPWIAIVAVAVAVVVGGGLVAVRAGRRRAAVIATGALAAVVLVLAAAGGVMAKEEGVLVTLDTPIPGDAAPGSTIELAWTMQVEPTDGSPATTPYEATPLIVRVTSRSGVPVDVTATHLGDGRYTAAITVPETGLGALDMGLPSETGGLLLLAEVFDAPPLIRTVGPGATRAAGETSIEGYLPLVAVGVGSAVLGTLLVVVVARRRRSGVGALTATD